MANRLVPSPLCIFNLCSRKQTGARTAVSRCVVGTVGLSSDDEHAAARGPLHARPSEVEVFSQHMDV